ncbi:MAG: adenylate/guanylate cyclase domain-containing protein [Deinococcales bacterium]
MICPSCRTANPDGARYCTECGTALSETSSFEGERKYATVLFADVVGSTALAEAIDPETWTEVMNGAFAFMNAAVARYGGTVGRLMGDAVLAFFGAPVALEDHAERAVWTALQLQEDARAYSARLSRTHGIDFRVRVGIASGLVVFAVVGNQAKTEYTAMGDAANLAARLQAAARPGRILVAAETHGLVRHRFEATATGAVAVKGKSGPVEAYEIVGPITGTTGGTTPQGVAAPMVGRDRELARLEGALRAAENGRGSVALVVGEAGVGKSRLLSELRARTAARRRDWSWWEGHALSYGQSLSYHPWRELLAPVVGISNAAAADAHAALVASVERLGLGPVDASALERLLLLNSDTAAGATDLVGAEDPIEQLGQGVRSLLRASAQGGPLVLVLEDLHWADTSSLELLEHTVEVTRNAPIVLIVLSRPEPKERSGGVASRLRMALRDDLIVIPLLPLAGEEAGQLLASLVAVDSLPVKLREAILRKTDGNPFFLEEVIHSLIDAGHLVRDGEGWRANDTTTEVEIPDTLLGVLSARLDRLPAPAKRVAQTAAVIGRTFARQLLADVCLEAPEPERIEPVDPHLGTLTAEDLVRQLAGSTLAEFSFKHALSQDAAYDSLLMRRRRELHRRTATVLERTMGADGLEIAAQLAYHYLRGEVWNEGARYALLAAEHARRLYALEDAHRHAADAVDALERMEDTEPRAYAEAVAAWTQLAVARRLHEDPVERKVILERLERAEPLARTLDGTQLLAELLVAHANVLSLSGFPALGYPMLLEANELDVARGGEQLALLSHFQASELLVAQDPRRAVEQAEEVVVLARRDRNRGFEAHALAIKALGHARLGDYREARATIEQALELAPTSGSTIKEADVRMVAGLVFYELGELERGVEQGSRGLEMSLSIQGQQCACAAYFVAGHGQLNAMRIPEAVEAFLSSRNLGEQTRGMEMYVNLATAGNAQADLLRGRRDAANEIKVAARNAKQLGDDFGSGYLTLELAAFELREGRPEGSIEVLQPALEYFRRNGLRPYLARALRLRAEADEALGHKDEALAARAEADELRRALDAALEESTRPAASPAHPDAGASAEGMA